MTTEERLLDAEAQYHLWSTGQAVVEVTDQNGEKIRYSTANIGRLIAYIESLKGRTASPPMGFFF